MSITYKDKTGRLYRVAEQPNDKGLYRMEYRDPATSAVFKPVVDYPGCENAENVQVCLDARAERGGWEAVGQDDASSDYPDPCTSCLCNTCGDNGCDNAPGCHANKDDCVRLGNTSKCDEYRPKAAPANPTCSAAATAAESPTVADPAPSDLGNGMAVAAAQSSDGAAGALAAGPATADMSMPAFDYSGLEKQTVADLHLAEREYSTGKRMAEMGLRRMAEAVAIAHDALCSTVVAQCDNGRFGKKEDTFRKWCDSVGISKDTAYRMLQVSAFFESSSPKEQKILETLSPTLLYSASKPSTSAEMAQAVKSGDITTNADFQRVKAELDAKNAQLAAEQKAREAAERKAKGLEESYRTAHSNEQYNIQRRQEAEAEANYARRQAASANEQLSAKNARIKELERSQVIETTAAPALTDEQLEQIKQEARDDAEREWLDFAERVPRVCEVSAILEDAMKKSWELSNLDAMEITTQGDLDAMYNLQKLLATIHNKVTQKIDDATEEGDADA